MALYTKVLADEASIGLPSSLTLGRRADVYLRSGELDLCMSDCAAALAVNPDSAKTLRTRGGAKMLLGEFDGSLKMVWVMGKATSENVMFRTDVVEVGTGGFWVG